MAEEKKPIHKYIFYYQYIGMGTAVSTVVFAASTKEAEEKAKVLRPDHTYKGFDVIEREPE